MAPKIAQFVIAPKRYQQFLHTSPPPNKKRLIVFSWKPQKVLKFKALDPPKMVRAYV